MHATPICECICERICECICECIYECMVAACEEYARRGARAICLLEHVQWRPLQPSLEAGMRLVHMIRDPVEV